MKYSTIAIKYQKSGIYPDTTFVLSIHDEDGDRRVGAAYIYLVQKAKEDDELRTHVLDDGQVMVDVLPDNQVFGIEVLTCTPTSALGELERIVKAGGIVGIRQETIMLVCAKLMLDWFDTDSLLIKGETPLSRDGAWDTSVNGSSNRPTTI